MVLEIEVNPDSIWKLERFLGTRKYKDLATSTQSFSRKLNEKRKKMKIPHIDGQVFIVRNPFSRTIVMTFSPPFHCSETLQQQQAKNG